PALAGLGALAAILLLTLGIGGPLVAVQQSEYAQQHAENAQQHAENARQQAALRAKAVTAQHDAEQQRREAIAAKVALEAEQETAVAQLYAMTISKAYSVWKSGNNDQVEQMLDSTPEKHRGWEWRFLKSLTRLSNRTLRGHASTPWRVGVDLANHQIVSLDWESDNPYVWDSNTGHLKRTLDISAIAVSFDGQLVAAVSAREPDVVRIINTTNDSPPLVLDGHGTQVSGASFGRGNRFVAGSAIDGTIHMWDLETGQHITSIEADPEIAEQQKTFLIAVSQDGRFVAAKRMDGKIAIFDGRSGKRLHLIQDDAGGPHPLTQIDFSPDGTRLASPGFDSIVRVYDTRSGSRVDHFSGHTGFVYAVQFDASGQRLASCGMDKTTRVWSFGESRDPSVFRVHSNIVNHATFSSDGRRLVTCADDKTLRLWTLDNATGNPEPADRLPEASDHIPAGTARAVSRSTATSQEYVQIDAHPRGVDALAFSADGRWMASGGWDHTSTVYDLQSSGPPLRYKQHEDRVGAVTFSADGQLVASATGSVIGTQAGQIHVWDARTGETRRKWLEHKAPIQFLQFIPGSNRLVSGAGGTTVGETACEIYLWDLKKAKPVGQISPKANKGVFGLAVSPDGQSIAVCTTTELTLWDVKTLKQRRSLARVTTALFRGLSFSPDSSKLAAGGSDKDVYVWDTINGKQVHKLSGHGDEVMSTAFHPKGNRLVSAAYDATIKVWDLSTGFELLSFEGHRAAAHGARFDPSGDRLASFGLDGAIHMRTATFKALQADEQWPVIFEDRFEREELGDDWQTVQGKWQVANGSARGTLLQNTSITGLFEAQIKATRLELPSTVDISYDVWTPDKIACQTSLWDRVDYDWQKSDALLAILLGTRVPGLNDGNPGSQIMLWGSARPTMLNKESGFVMEPGRKYRFRTIRAPDRFAVFVDGQRLIEADIPELVLPALVINGAWGRPGDTIFIDNVVIRAPQSTEAERLALPIVRESFDRLGARRLVVADLKSNRDLEDNVRRQALRIADLHPDEPENIADTLWSLAVTGTARPEVFRSGIALIQDQMRVGDRDPGALRTLGALQLRAGNPAAAIKVLQEATRGHRRFIGIAPTSTLCLLAIAYSEVGEKPNARESLRRAEDNSLSIGFSYEKDEVALLAEARRTVEPDVTSNDHEIAIRELTARVLLATRDQDINAWRRCFTDDARIVRGHRESAAATDIDIGIEQCSQFYSYQWDLVPPSVMREGIRDAVHISRADESAQVRQRIVFVGAVPVTDGGLPFSWVAQEQNLDLQLTSDGWRIRRMRIWDAAEKDEISATGQLALDADYWASWRMALETARKTESPSVVLKSIKLNRLGVPEPGPLKVAAMQGLLPKLFATWEPIVYWLCESLVAAERRELVDYRTAIDEMADLVSERIGLPLPAARARLTQRRLAKQPTAFDRGVSLRIPAGLSVNTKSRPLPFFDLRGAWTTLGRELIMVFTNDRDSIQTCKDVLNDPERAAFFDAAKLKVMHRRQLRVAGYDAVEFIIMGPGTRGSFHISNGEDLMTSRWILIPSGKTIYGFLVCAPMGYLDLANAEFDRVIQTLKLTGAVDAGGAAGER
ncbi:MAG: nuclear transport factor 2 family protein, partial [Planctomycetaceae bacterium]